MTSSTQSHECTKLNCFYCREVRRLEQPPIEWYFESLAAVLPVHAPNIPRKWNGCEKLVLLSELHSPFERIMKLLPRRTKRAVITQLSIYRVKYNALKVNNTYVRL